MKKSRIGLLVISFAAIAGIVFWRFGTQQKPTPIAVTLGKVETVDILRRVTASGTLEAADTETLAISTLRRVKTVKVAEGEKVRKGQVLAEMDVSDLALQRQKLLLTGAQIEADLKELAKPTLTAASTAVKAQVSQLELDLANTRRKLADAETKLERDQTLYDAGSLSSQALESSRSLRDDLSDQVKRTATALNTARSQAGDLPDETAKKQDNLLRQQAQNNLDLALLDRQLTESHIIASLEGLLVTFPLKEGRYPESGATVRIEDTSSWKVVIRLPQEDAAQIQLAQPAEILLKGLPDAYPAKVSDVAREARVESGSRTPKVDITLMLAKSDERLVSGFDAEASVETGRMSQVSAVKREAVGKDENGKPVLFLLESASSDSSGALQGNIRMIPIVPGLEDDTHLAIGDAVKAGVPLVLAPPVGLSDGALVEGSVIP